VVEESSFNIPLQIDHENQNEDFSSYCAAEKFWGLELEIYHLLDAYLRQITFLSLFFLIGNDSAVFEKC
jgi:hypothetical protein